MLKSGVLVSGDLGIQALTFLKERVEIVFCMTDYKSVTIISECEINGIPCFIGNPRNQKERLEEFLADKHIGYLFSVNYLFIVDSNVLEKPTKLAINLHGSLLPKYRGRTPHVWAIINNEKETGVTAHLMESGCDTGDILLQKTFQIPDDCTGAEILKKFKLIYPQVLEELLMSIETNTWEVKPQNHDMATYFGKRTSEDGLINWSWQRERIYNWIRAQAHPYPGAFTYYKGLKLVIHKCIFSSHGFKDSQPNGEVLRGGATPIIKTANGAVQLLEWKMDGADVLLEVNEILKDV